jgi:hypothetical protein
MDSSVTDHITSDLDRLTMHDPYTGHNQVHAANGSDMDITHIGTSIIPTTTHPLTLNNVLHVPSAHKNLIFIHRLTLDNDMFIEFHRYFFLITDRQTKKVLLHWQCKSGLYPLPPSISKFRKLVWWSKVSNNVLVFDYDDTFSHVVKPATIRLVLYLTVSQGWTLHQLDVENMFLHGVLQEKVYMKQPPRFVDPTRPSYHCRLDKGLYGLKQAHWVWYSRLSDKLQSMGFLPSQADVSLFHYRKGSVTMFLLVYVDDIIVASSFADIVTALLCDLKDDFALKDFGSLHYFLGIEVCCPSDEIHLSQAKYTADILDHAGMTSCKGVTTPLPSNTKLTTQDGDLLGLKMLLSIRVW